VGQEKVAQVLGVAVVQGYSGAGVAAAVAVSHGLPILANAAGKAMSKAKEDTPLPAIVTKASSQGYV